MDTLRLLETALAARWLSNRQLCIASGILINVYMRTRFKDLSNLINLESEGDIVSGGLSGAKNADKDRLQVVIAGPSASLTGLRWFEVLHQLRAEAGFSLDVWPVVPRLYKDGPSQDESATNREFNSEFRDLLQAMGIKDFMAYSSHSLKATMLNLSSQAGIGLNDRAALGYHKLKGESGSVRSYNRDRLEKPVQELQEAIKEVHAGRLKPSKQRTTNSFSLPLRKAPTPTLRKSRVSSTSQQHDGNSTPTQTVGTPKFRGQDVEQPTFAVSYTHLTLPTKA